MIKIYTDSTCCIPEKTITDCNINILPLKVTIAGETYLETKISTKKFFGLMKSTNEFPKSSQPSVGDIEKQFRNDIQEGHSIVCVFISAKMSGTLNAAVLAKNNILKKQANAEIEIIDSKSNCMQLGFAAIAGAKAAKKEDASIKSVVGAINDVISRSRFIFIPETLKYLEKGGRIGKANALIGNALHILPILTVLKGETSVITKVRTRRKAIQKIVDIVKHDMETLGLDKLIVHHIDCIESAQIVKDMLKNQLNIDGDMIGIGPVIGAHVGPGSLGIVYCTQKVHPLNA